MTRKRRTKKQYAALYDSNPFALFPSKAGETGTGAKVTLWPNGANEIWISDPTAGHSVRIVASKGPAGLGVRITQHVGATPMTVRAYDKEYATVVKADTVREVELTCYNPDARSQAVKRWYDEEETAEDIALLGESYRRRSRNIPERQEG